MQCKLLLRRLIPTNCYRSLTTERCAHALDRHVRLLIRLQTTLERTLFVQIWVIALPAPLTTRALAGISPIVRVWQVKQTHAHIHEHTNTSLDIRYTSRYRTRSAYRRMITSRPQTSARDVLASWVCILHLLCRSHTHTHHD